MQNTKKVIILDRVDSSIISQAIFILKDNPSDEFSAVEEAERIVRNYTTYGMEKRKSSIPFIVFVLGFFLVFAALYIAFL